MKVKKYLEALLQDNKKMTKAIMITGSLVMSFYLLYIYVWAASNSFLMADDFAHANDIGVKYTGIMNALAESYRFAADKFMNWQGTYFSMFSQALFSPLNGAGVVQLRIIMVLNMILIYASLFGLFAAISKRFFLRVVWHYVLPSYAMTVFAMNAYKIWSEVYYWYSGAISYSWPFSFMCVGLTLYLLWNVKQKTAKKGYLIGACICLFLTSGGSLQVAGTSCYFILLLVLFDTWREKKISVARWSVFLSALVGALINTIAPGNYVRYESGGESELHFLRAISATLLTVKSELDWLLTKTSFVFILLLMFVVGIFAGQYLQCKKYKIILFSGMLLATPFVTMFPVALAYDASYFPNRCQYILDIVLMGTFMFGAAALGVLLKDIYATYKERLQLMVIFTGIAIAIFVSNETYDLSELNMFKTKIALDSGSIQNYSKNCIEMYEYIENADEMDVVVEKLPLTLPTFTKVLITDDPTFWINEALAVYFDKNSVRAVYEYLE